MTAKAQLALSFAASAALIATAAIAAPVTEGGMKFSATLTGANEITGGASEADMDATGTAIITVNRGQQRVCWEITSAGTSGITGAHIHLGGATTQGGVVVPLTAAQNGTAVGCTSAPVSATLIEAIIANPQNYYVNIHSTQFTGGAIRGQLSKGKP